MFDRSLFPRFGQQQKAFRKRIKRRLRVLLWVLPALTFSLWFAYFLRFDGAIPSRQTAAFWSALPLVLGVKTAIFSLGKVGRVWHAFASLPEALRLLKATWAATIGVAAADFLIHGGLLPRGVILIDGCLSTLLLCGFLVLYRCVRERRGRGPRNPTAAGGSLVVGTAASTEVFLREIQRGSCSKHQPVGLVTDLSKMLHHEIAGVPVVGLVGRDNVAKAAAATQVQDVMLISGDLPGHEVRQILADCDAAAIRVQVIPEVGRIVDGHVDFQPREVAIEDLLGREPISLDQDDLYDWLHDQTILVTGSCGSIGSEIARQLLPFNPGKLILLDRSETGQFFLERELSDAVAAGQVEVVLADATDEQRIDQLFGQHRPQIVFHAAAYKHVPLMEAHPQEAVRNIVQASRILADAAHRHACESFVMISTDKAVNPTNVMGGCKRVAELYVQSMVRHSETRFVTVRFGNVLGSNGSVIPIFREQIARGGPVTVTHPEMTRYFMTIPEASQLVIQAGRQGEGGEIFVLDMGEPVKILDLARDMIKLSGLEPDEDIAIEQTGLRPGEKLYEELYAAEEIRQATAHPKILVADSVAVEHRRMERALHQLLAAAEASPEAIRGNLQQIVPSYRPLPANPKLRRRTREAFPPRLADFPRRAA